ncbi:transcriptional regulator FnrL [Paracoccus sulfuroxidans]|uniref:CRP/FNR family transcriptional regulator n=1 Tax=Paracoccus sulfuroxidans TaxID=384678 RepID=A0A562NL51_9RHOB|nr:Crp/Fnr family transcriptional regulator [Paracoccus sulfuroxidans]TWI32888.1 CRP/FNR family transcriptional regulator [Paracoccus sulfuroxidans]
MLNLVDRTTTKPGCNDCPIRERAVCAHCESDELARLESTKFYRKYSAGQTIIWAGEPMEFVASVITGMASLTQQMEDGRTQMVGMLLPSDFLGRPGRQTATYTVTATSDLHLCCFHRKPFETLMVQTPHLAMRLLEMTLDELDAARDWLLLLGRKTAREKIASFLVFLARREAALGKRQPQGQITIGLPLTREALADYLGLTLETVSRQLNGMKREGMLQLEGKRRVILSDFDMMLAESGDDGDGGLPI